MAGFSSRASDVLDIEVVPHPAVMVAFDLGDTPIVIEDGSGRQRRDSVVAGLAPKGVRARGGQSFDVLQLRMSPVVAHAVLRASSELGGAVVDLDGLWGRDAACIQEQLRAAASWPDRFAIAEAAL